MEAMTCTVCNRPACADPDACEAVAIREEREREWVEFVHSEGPKLLDGLRKAMDARSRVYWGDEREAEGR